MELQVSRVTLDGEACAESLTLTITIESDAIGRRGEAEDVAHLMMLCPALGVVGADDRRVIDEAEVIPHDLMPPVGLEDMTEVKEELAVCAVSIGSSEKPDAVGGGQFGLDAEVLQAHRVVARGSGFLGLVELSYGAQRVSSAIGKDRYIAEVTNTRPREVGEAEGIDDAVGLVVATAGIPTDEVSVGAKLHHRIWACSPWEGVPVLTRTDERIDETQKILAGTTARSLRGAGRQEEGGRKEGC